MKQDIRIKEICKEKGITLEDLAKRLGILRTSLSQALSRNSFSTDKLSDIANALNVPMWQLFASPEEVQKENNNIVCPHCRNPIKVTIIKE
nr:MAG TPA: helix-turn-helix domain protein [Caudoviricetes sp.]